MSNFPKSIYLLFILSVLVLSSCATNEAKEEEKTEETAETVRFYLGTGTTEGIFSVMLNMEDGSMEIEHKNDNILNPSFIALSPNNEYVYAATRVEGQKEGGVSAFKIDPTTHQLTFINQQSSMGQGPCYISVDPSGKWVLVANYSSGSIAIYPVGEDGSLGEATDVAQHEGSSIDPERQKGPHAHYVNIGLGGLVYAADLGTDKVMIYQIDENGKLQPHSTPFVTCPPGGGPRHVDYHPNGKYAYLMNEMGGAVTVYKFDESTGSFETLQTLSSLPEDFDGYNKSADIHVHPSGKFLYASNRGDFDSVTAYAIDETTGMISVVDHENEGIVWPRNFNIDPSGKFLIVANKDDNSLVSFTIDAQTGALEATGHKVEVPTPMCVKFLR